MLIGDVGGTKTRLGLFSLDARRMVPQVEATFASKSYPNLQEIAREFLKRSRAQVEYASFGVAGPVVDGHARITNLPWQIDEEALAGDLGLSGVHLLNDLAAIATNVLFLGRNDLWTLNPGKADPRGVVAVIAPGTGLGEAFVTREGGKHNVHPSEGGHADFAPTNRVQLDLLDYLLERFDHVSYEKVCSGIGIRNIHAYFEKVDKMEPPAWHLKELEADDPIPPIAAAALRKDKVCGRCPPTMEVFAAILGAEAGNLALKVMATGGVYIGGGIPRNVLPLIKDGSFMDSFTKKGRMSDLLARIPVRVILNPRTALLGAARSGFEWMKLKEAAK